MSSRPHLILLEEFGRADAFRWSRDSKKIAFWHTDQTGVQSFLLYDDTTERYPVSTTLKYPKAGEKNSVVKIGVADISSGQIVWMDIGEEVCTDAFPPHLLQKDIYIPRIDWTTKPNILAIQRLNRKQNKLELLFADVNDGSVKTVLTDVSTTGWVEVTDDFIFFEVWREKCLVLIRQIEVRPIFMDLRKEWIPAHLLVRLLWKRETNH